jgi:hypothetical protein
MYIVAVIALIPSFGVYTGTAYETMNRALRLQPKTRAGGHAPHHLSV